MNEFLNRLKDWLADLSAMLPTVPSIPGLTTSVPVPGVTGPLGGPLRFTFEQPYWLFALILVPFILMLAGPWMRRAAGWRRGTALIVRALVLCLLIVAQARPTLWENDE